MQPELLIADEPTGQLDSETGRQIMRLLRTVVVADGITAVVATHDPALHELADVVLALEDGSWFRRSGQAHRPGTPGCRAGMSRRSPVRR